MLNRTRGLLMAGALTASFAATSLFAQMPPPPAHDYKAAPAGTYAIDPGHTGIVVRVAHMGFSYEIFRFSTVSGDLGWDPANPAKDTLNITVDPASITTAPTPPTDFAKELSGDKFLNVAKFPTATFVSKAFHATDATHGRVEGDMTIMGVTKPAVFEVELIGAGKGFKGPVIGVTAKTTIQPSDYGLPKFISAPIEIIVDSEFDAKG